MMLEEFEQIARAPGMREIGAAYVALREAERKMRNEERKLVKHLADTIEEFVNDIEKKILKARKTTEEEQDIREEK
jgi:hypothetical protein